MTLRHRRFRPAARPALSPVARRVAVVLGAGLLAVALVPTASAATPASAPSAASAPSRTVSFAGASVRVPSDWPVVDVDGVPGCVRYDRHAVYLGSPSESTCPAGLVGRTATVQILRAATPATGRNPTVTADAAGDLTIADGGNRVIVTGDASDPAVSSAIAASVRIGEAPVGSAAVARAVTQLATQTATQTPAQTATQMPTQTPRSALPQAVVPQSVPAPVKFTGRAFDACTAPSLNQIDAWQSSAYGAVAVYVGGTNRGCSQPNLTAGWVSAMKGRGWHLLPIYVGLQAPCTTYKQRISTKLATAKSQGADAAADAAAQMKSLGLAAGNPVYLDMESWNDGNYTGACTQAVMAFSGEWTAGLHAAGYTSGFYSSATTGITALVKWIQDHSTFLAPDAVWFARWDGNPVTTDPEVPAALWPSRQRVKQFQGPHDETYGGRTINIDSDVVDGPVTAATLALSTTSLAAAVPGRAYSFTLKARAGTGPYTFRVTAGALPKGLTLTPSGTISGTTATVTAGAPVTVSVTDKAGATATRSYSLVSTYTDVPAGSQFFGDIAWLSNAGITGGYTDGSFKPQGDTLRQEMAAFLYRYAHAGKHASNQNCPSPFSDVPAGSQFCGAISWLASTGITGGTDRTHFSPTRTVPRQEMAAFLYRYAHAGKHASNQNCPSPFSDVPAGSQFCGAITWLKATGITQGNGDGTFSPGKTVARQAMAAFLHRLNGLPG